MGEINNNDPVAVATRLRKARVSSVNPHTLLSRSKKALTENKVGDVLDVGREDGCDGIIMKHVASKADRNGLGHIVLSPRQARHLASLLMLHAEEAEADKAGKYKSAGTRGD